jgi:hypothetical protein
MLQEELWWLLLLFWKLYQVQKNTLCVSLWRNWTRKITNKWVRVRFVCLITQRLKVTVAWDYRNFMFCWPCISKYAFNDTDLMHCLSSVYWVTTPLHVSGFLAAHHQEAAMFKGDNWYVLYVLVDCRRAWRPTDSRLKINSASSWFHYTRYYLNLIQLINLIQVGSSRKGISDVRWWTSQKIIN